MKKLIIAIAACMLIASAASAQIGILDSNFASQRVIVDTAGRRMMLTPDGKLPVDATIETEISLDDASVQLIGADTSNILVIDDSGAARVFLADTEITTVSGEPALNETINTAIDIEIGDTATVQVNQPGVFQITVENGDVHFSTADEADTFSFKLFENSAYSEDLTEPDNLYFYNDSAAEIRVYIRTLEE